MSHCIFHGYRRLRRLRSIPAAALAVALAACDHTEPLDPGGALQDEVTIAEVEAPALAVRQSGGIAFGMAAQPVAQLGDLYSGGKVTLGPGQMRSTLAAVKARGGRVVVMLAGNPRYYKDGNGRFSLSKWKARVDRFKGIDFGGYINDGTIIGHYLIDEPNDKANWNGTTVSQSVLDEMGRHSKQRWPKMATIVRTHPSYFKSKPRYVDAAWAQYLSRRGSVQNYIRESVADAQRRGLQLVVGLNVVHGGTPNRTRMTPKQVESYGSALLSSSYPCAFVSWKYNDSQLSGASMKSAMKTLRKKAEGRSRKSCLS
ncbi:hypothetical protein BH24GEM1_BH24GEM1_00650 [soil metagenome]